MYAISLSEIGRQFGARSNLPDVGFSQYGSTVADAPGVGSIASSIGTVIVGLCTPAEMSDVEAVGVATRVQRLQSFWSRTVRYFASKLMSTTLCSSPKTDHGVAVAQTEWPVVVGLRVTTPAQHEFQTLSDLGAPTNGHGPKYGMDDWTKLASLAKEDV
jgi:hypothetical protein